MQVAQFDRAPKATLNRGDAHCHGCFVPVLADRIEPVTPRQARGNHLRVCHRVEDRFRLRGEFVAALEHHRFLAIASLADAPVRLARGRCSAVARCI